MFNRRKILYALMLCALLGAAVMTLPTLMAHEIRVSLADQLPFARKELAAMNRQLPLAQATANPTGANASMPAAMASIFEAGAGRATAQATPFPTLAVMEGPLAEEEPAVMEEAMGEEEDVAVEGNTAKPPSVWAAKMDLPDAWTSGAGFWYGELARAGQPLAVATAIPSLPELAQAFPTVTDEAAVALVLKPVAGERIQQNALQKLSLEEPFQQALNFLMNLNGIESLSPEGFALTVDPEGTLWGIKAVGSDAPVAIAKLIEGISRNLQADEIYIPDEETLARVMDVPIYMLRCTPQGQVSTLSVTYRQLTGFAALAQGAQMGKIKGLLPRSMLMQELVYPVSLQAQTPGENNPEKSRQIVLQHVRQYGLGTSEKIPGIAITHMAPYAYINTQPFCTSGHHVTVLDMEDGQVYTFTTDVVSGKVIGLASENSQPYLTQEPLRNDEGPKAFNIQDTLENTAQDMVERASAFLGKAKLPTINMSGTASPQTYTDPQTGIVMPLWKVVFEPGDAEARRLDPQKKLYPQYTFEYLDGDNLALFSLAYLSDGTYSAMDWPISLNKEEAIGDLETEFKKKGFSENSLLRKYVVQAQTEKQAIAEKEIRRCLYDGPIDEKALVFERVVVRRVRGTYAYDTHDSVLLFFSYDWRRDGKPVHFVYDVYNECSVLVDDQAYQLQPKGVLNTQPSEQQTKLRAFFIQKAKQYLGDLLDINFHDESRWQTTAQVQSQLDRAGQAVPVLSIQLQSTASAATPAGEENLAYVIILDAGGKLKLWWRSGAADSQRSRVTIHPYAEDGTLEAEYERFAEESLLNQDVSRDIYEDLLRATDEDMEIARRTAARVAAKKLLPLGSQTNLEDYIIRLESVNLITDPGNQHRYDRVLLIFSLTHQNSEEKSRLCYSVTEDTFVDEQRIIE